MKPYIVRFQSPPAETPFAPEWNYVMFEGQIDNVDFSKISDYILYKEKEILNLPLTIREGKFSDGYTGLGENSTTARFDRFNVLKWQHPEIQKLKEQILNFYDLFLSGLSIPSEENLYIQCWANVLRNGEQIQPHIHSVKPDCYLGGHICVQCEDTATNYINPVNQINDPEVYRSENVVGKITLFQNCIPHYTDLHNGTKERITIAFDLSLTKYDDNFLKIR
jgi:hypothetical protein